MSNVRMEPCSYTVVTKDICKSWTTTGKADIQSQFSEHYQQSKKDVTVGFKVRKLLHELVWRYLGEYISTEDMNEWLSKAAQEHPEIQSILVDVLIVVDAECSLEDNEDHKSRIAKITSLISKLGANRLLQERLDLETGTLEKAAVIQNQKMFQQKYIKTKTRLFYKQQKFNLLREEIEGYSKLTTELYECKNPDETLQNVKSLIGCFNIDPNRVLDICLEWLEQSVDSPNVARRLISNYLRLCDATTLTNLLGFKFQFYASAPQGTPESLYKTAGILLQSGLVQLTELFPHLSPADESIKADYDKVIQAALEKLKRMGVVSLGEKKAEVDIDAMMESVNNQKFGLARALVELGSWDSAQLIIDRYPQYCAVSDSQMAVAITKRCHQIIDPLYREKGAKKFGKGKALDSCVPDKLLVNTFEDIYTNLLPTLTTLGPMLSVDPLLFTKIVRILRSFFKEYRHADANWRNQNKKTFATLLCIMEEVLLPSMTLLDCPAVQSEEIWQVFKALDYELRYRLYGYWKNSCFKLHPKLIIAQAKAVDRTKYIMRRLTKDTVKQSGRQLGKISHSNPGTLFDTILVQIQRYDNLIGPVVDSLKYLTNLTYDMLLYCVIEALANPEKEQMKTDGTSISEWLKSLANFCGTVCKKYSIDFVGLLQYVANKLKSGNSLDLLLLREIVQKMSGIEANMEVTEDQLNALAGGDILKTEGGYFGLIRNVKKPSMRLRETLIDHKLALPLCLLMSTHRAHIVFKEGVGQHLKLVGKLTDQCHDTLFLFGDFLSTNLSMEEYTKQVPPIEVLIEQYGTPWDVAFFISRRMYNHQVQNEYENKTSAEGLTDSDKSEIFIDCADSIFLPIARTVESMHTENVWQDINPNFYTAFWTMTMYDISTPTSSYDKEIKKLKDQMSQLDTNQELNSGKRKRDKERLQQMIDKLGEERVKQEEHRLQVFGRLQRQCENWFPARTTKNDAITTFLRLCLFPRCSFSDLDAQYCARMVQLIHELRIPNFSTLLCYDRVFTDISYIVASLTENEASRFGRFLAGMLSTVMRWHSDPDIYEKECGDFPGFITVVRSNAKSSDGGTRANQLDYENYRHVCHKWQYKLTKALVLCLESGEYIQIRNGLMILTKVLQFFPMVQSLGAALEKRVEKVRTEEKDKRQDLYALAMGYAGQLKGRKNSMVPENEFHTKDGKPAPTMKDIQKQRQKKQKQQKDDDSEKMDEDSSSRNKSESRTKSEANNTSSSTSKTMKERIAENRRKRESGMQKENNEEENSDDRDEKRKRGKTPESQEKLPKRAKTAEKDGDEDNKREKSSSKPDREKSRGKSKSHARDRSRDRSESTSNRNRRR